VRAKCDDKVCVAGRGKGEGKHGEVGGGGIFSHIFSWDHHLPPARDGILGQQFDKRLRSFAPCYSQSLLLADFR
jgi:hypothetical protein